MPGRYTSARYVGRESAFARLAAVLDDATSGRARAMLISGPAGVGISRFLDEAIGRIGGLTEPMRVLRGGAMPAGTDEPYGPVARSVGPALDALSDDELDAVLGPAVADVARILPSIAARLDRTGRLPSTRREGAPERQQARALEGVLGMLGRLGERQPTVLVLEDLHRADAATRALVTFLARIASDQRLALVVSDQPDIVPRDDPWTSALASIAAAPRPMERLALPLLDRDELAALIEGIEGERASASLLLLVAERSGGSPLVAEELLAARRELPTASLTGSLDELVMSRLVVRSLECRRILRLLAPAGRPLDPEHLAAVAADFEVETDRPAPRSVSAQRRGGGLLDADLAAGLAEGIEHGFLVEHDGAVGFRHELIGAAVVGDLLPLALTRHHAALATGLADYPAAAARHWLAAHDAAAAREAAIAAAELAAERHAAADELEALELALALSDRGKSHDRTTSRPERPAAIRASDRAELQERAAIAAFSIGRTSRATAYLESAIGALDARRDRVRVGLLYDRLAHVRRAAGDPAGARSAAQRAIDLVPRDPSPERATVVATLAQLYLVDGIFSDGQRLAREAIKVARACDPVARDQEIHATTTLGVALAWGRDPNAAIELLREAERSAREIDDPDALFRITANLTTVLDLVGQRAEAVEVAYRGIEDAKRAGLEAVYGNFLAGNVTESLILLGRWPEARRLSARALAWLPVGVVFLMGIVQLAVVEIETEAGERAARLLGQTVLEFDALREPQLAAPVLPGCRVVRVVARRCRRRRSLGGTGLGRGLEHRGMGARRPDGRDGHAGRRGRRRRGARASAAGPARRRTDAHGGSPADGRRARRGRWRAADHRVTSRRGGVSRDRPRVPAPPRGRRRPSRLEPGRDDVAGTVGAVRGRPGPLAPGRGDHVQRWGAGRPDASAQAVARGCPRSRSDWRRGRSCGTCASWPAARGSICPRTWTGCWARACPRRRRRGAGGHDHRARRRSHRERPLRPRAHDRRRPGAGRPAPGHVRAERAGAGGPRPGRPGPHQPRDRRAAVHQPEDRRRARRQHPGQAGGVRPRGGGGGRHPPGSD